MNKKLSLAGLSTHTFEATNGMTMRFSDDLTGVYMNEKQMEEAEATYKAEKQANFDRLIDKLMKVLIQT